MSSRRSVDLPKGRQNLRFFGTYFMIWSSARFEQAAAARG